MDEQTCPRCGAKSAAGAAYCWQCFARFGAPAPAESQAAPTATAGPLATALGRGPGAGTPAAVISEPATVTRWQPQQKAGGDAALGWIVRGLVFVVAAVGGYFAYQWLFGGFPFPEQIAGQQRMDSDLVEDFEDLLRDFSGAFDVEVEMALYGGVMPAYFMAAAEVPGGQDPGEFYRGFTTGSGVTTDFAAVDPNTVICTGFPGGVGAQCSWLQEDTVILLQGFSSTDADLQAVAEDVSSDLD